MAAEAEPSAARRKGGVGILILVVLLLVSIGVALWLGWRVDLLQKQLELVGVGGEGLQARALYIARLALNNVQQAVEQKNFGDALREVRVIRTALLMAGELGIDTRNANGLLSRLEASLNSPSPETTSHLQALVRLLERISPRPFHRVEQELRREIPAPEQEAPAAPPATEQPAPAPTAPPSPEQPIPPPTAPPTTEQPAWGPVAPSAPEQPAPGPTVPGPPSAPPPAGQPAPAPTVPSVSEQLAPFPGPGGGR